MKKFIFLCFFPIIIPRIYAQEKLAAGIGIKKEEVPISVLESFSVDFKSDMPDNWHIVMPQPKITHVAHHSKPNKSIYSHKKIQRRAKRDARMNAKKEALILKRKSSNDSEERQKIHEKLQKMARKNKWSVEPIDVPNKYIKSKRSKHRKNRKDKENYNIEDLTSDPQGLMPTGVIGITYSEHNSKLPQYVNYQNTDFYIYDIHGNLVYSQCLVIQEDTIVQRIKSKFNEEYPNFTEFTIYKTYSGPKENISKTCNYKFEVMIGHLKKEYYYNVMAERILQDT